MAAVGRVLDSIAEDIEHDLLDAAAIAHDEREIFGIVVRELVLVAAGLKLRRAEHGVDGGGEGETHHVHLAASGVKARERQKILHDVGHAVCFADDNVEKVILCLAAQVVARLADGLGIGADICERRAQLVGDVGDELLAALLGFALLGHVMQHDQNAAAFLVGKWRKVKLHAALADGKFPFHIVAALHGDDMGKRADGFKQLAVHALVRRAA